MATKTEVIRARAEPKLKKAAEKVFAGLGMTATEAITLFYKQVVYHRGIPFELRIPNVPNAETRRAIEEVQQGKNLRTYESVDAWFAEITKGETEGDEA